MRLSLWAWDVHTQQRWKRCFFNWMISTTLKETKTEHYISSLMFFFSFTRIVFIALSDFLIIIGMTFPRIRLWFACSKMISIRYVYKFSRAHSFLSSVRQFNRSHSTMLYSFLLCFFSLSSSFISFRVCSVQMPKFESEAEKISSIHLAARTRSANETSVEVENCVLGFFCSPKNTCKYYTHRMCGVDQITIDAAACKRKVAGSGSYHYIDNAIKTKPLFACTL